MARKRAPGGGRKPIGSAAAQPLTIRIDDNLRAQLETSARKRLKRKPNWNLSQEILCRLRWSLEKEREDRRDPALRAVCDIISGMAHGHLHADHPQTRWHRDPFTFRAFKLAVAGILDRLEPSGEMRPPSTKFSRNIFSPFDTPEALAEYAVNKELIRLFNNPPNLAQDVKAEFVRGREEQHPSLDDTEYDALALLGEIEHSDRVLARTRRALGIKEPKESKEFLELKNPRSQKQ